MRRPRYFDSIAVYLSGPEIDELQAAADARREARLSSVALPDDPE